MISRLLQHYGAILIILSLVVIGVVSSPKYDTKMAVWGFFSSPTDLLVPSSPPVYHGCINDTVFGRLNNAVSVIQPLIAVYTSVATEYTKWFP